MTSQYVIIPQNDDPGRDPGGGGTRCGGTSAHGKQNTLGYNIYYSAMEAVDSFKAQLIVCLGFIAVLA